MVLYPYSTTVQGGDFRAVGYITDRRQRKVSALALAPLREWAAVETWRTCVVVDLLGDIFLHLFDL
jgi:hypothetical protein